MKKIAELNINKTLRSKYEKFRKRLAVRSIVIDNDKKIALAYVSSHDYYKIPGGGVDEGEDIMQALHRECLEESGVQIKDIRELGYIIDINSIWALIQESYCYISRVDGVKKEPKFTKKERSKGFELHWVPIEKVMQIMESAQPKRDTEKHLKQRDLLFVKAFLKEYNYDLY